MANTFHRSRMPLAVGRSPRRLTDWFAGASQSVETALAASTSVLFASLNAAALAVRPFTVVRTRGWIWVASDQVAAFEVPFGGAALAVVSDQASAIGVTAVPTPITDEDSDLFFMYQHFIASGAGQAASQSNGSRLFEFDSKAQRKVNADQDIVQVIENSNTDDGLVFVMKLRMLVKLY